MTNYAGFWRRFMALAIDGFIVWLLCAITIIPWFVPPICLIIAALYRVIFETSSLKGTPGKVMMDICVIKADGSTLTVKDSLIRFAVSILSSALLCFGYLMSLFTEKRQTLHDFVANTLVVKTTFDEKNYWNVFLSQSKALFGSSTHPVDSGKPVNTQSLEELFNLYQKGALTDEEYNAKKAEFLKRL
jgi:uncharacterized RDD family membrane protein YckC